MLDRLENCKSLKECANDPAALDDFRDWFEEDSWNLHQKGDEQLSAAIYQSNRCYPLMMKSALIKCAYWHALGN